MRRIQSLIAELWRRQGPFVSHHVGDMPWRLYQHLRKLDEVRIRLWLRGTATVAFGWHWIKDDAVDFEVHPDHLDLVADVVGWAGARDVWILDRRPELIARVEALGHARTDSERTSEHHVRDLTAAVGDPALPAGYRLRTVREGDLARRVAVHRAAFAPSRVVPRGYARVMRAWPYRRSLDHVIEGPDGSFAAFCLAWLDRANRVGLLEPVGTHPDHQRRGLATAVCLGALGSLRQAGARLALVNSITGSAATSLYERLGMRSVARHIALRRDA